MWHLRCSRCVQDDSNWPTVSPHMQNAELLILLLISVAGFGLLARKIRVPDPIVLVLGGLVVSLIPGLPNVELQPDYVFLIVLPPLLYAQAWFTSWKDFCDNIRPITML